MHPRIPIEEVRKIIPTVLSMRRKGTPHGAKGKNRNYVLVVCPIQGRACRRIKPRWVQWNTKLRKSKGTCASCTKGIEGHITPQGYRVITVARRKQMLEHRCVMEEYLGRKLHKGETIHHINGKRADNKIRNLELRMSGNHPKGWSLRQMREYLKTVPKSLGGLK